MNKARLIKSLSCSLLAFTLQAKADISSDMTSFFNSLGFQTNTTGAGAYEGQAAGLYTGGQLFARQEVRQMNLGYIEFPSYRGGCGGIDMYMGGFSFINADELVNMFEAIGNNALGFTWLLAMDTISPSINNATESMQTLASQINSFNINSCESAATLVGGMWPKTDEAQKQICANVGASTGLYADRVAAMHGCGAEGQRAKILRDNQEGDYKEYILPNTNIAWKAIQKNDFLKKDPQLAELFMSLTGTVVINVPGDDKTKPRYTPYHPLGESAGLIKALMYGDDAKIYHCSEYDNCMSITHNTVSIDEASGFVHQVQLILDGIVKKVSKDKEGLSEQEIAFLGATSLPIYKILNVEAAYSTNGSLLNLHSYAEMIALDILHQYLSESLDIMLASSQLLHMEDDLIQPYKNGIKDAKEALYKLQVTTKNNLSKNIDLIQRTKALEQELAGKLSSHLVHVLGWGHGVR